MYEGSADAALEQRKNGLGSQATPQQLLESDTNPAAYMPRRAQRSLCYLYATAMAFLQVHSRACNISVFSTMQVDEYSNIIRTNWEICAKALKHQP